MGSLSLTLIAATALLLVGLVWIVIRSRPLLRLPRRPLTMNPDEATRIIESTPHAVMVTDAHGKIQSVNRAFTAITGYTAREAIGHTPRLLKSGRHSHAFYAGLWRSLARDGKWQGEIWNRRKSGDEYPEWLSITALRDKKRHIVNFVAIFSDINDAKVSDQETLHMAFHDELTGLPKRSLLVDRIGQAVARADRGGGRVAVMFADLDDFKDVNDNYGHSVGDLLLRLVAERMRSKVRGADTVARIGGDEFAIVIDAVTETADVARRAKEVVEAMLMPMNLGGRNVVTSLTLGVAMYPEDGKNSDELIEAADRAMYRAKREGKGRYTFHSQSYTTELPARGSRSEAVTKPARGRR